MSSAKWRQLCLGLNVLSGTYQLHWHLHQRSWSSMSTWYKHTNIDQRYSDYTACSTHHQLGPYYQNTAWKGSKSFAQNQQLRLASRSSLLHKMRLCFHLSKRKIVLLITHWGRDKMDDISQTTLSSSFSWMKMFEFRLKFHWNLFLRVELTIFQHWFR